MAPAEGGAIRQPLLPSVLSQQAGSKAEKECHAIDLRRPCRADEDHHRLFQDWAVVRSRQRHRNLVAVALTEIEVIPQVSPPTILPRPAGDDEMECHPIALLQDRVHPADEEGLHRPCQDFPAVRHLQQRWDLVGAASAESEVIPPKAATPAFLPRHGQVDEMARHPIAPLVQARVRFDHDRRRLRALLPERLVLLLVQVGIREQAPNLVDHPRTV